MKVVGENKQKFASISALFGKFLARFKFLFYFFTLWRGTAGEGGENPQLKNSDRVWSSRQFALWEKKDPGPKKKL